MDAGHIVYNPVLMGNQWNICTVPCTLRVDGRSGRVQVTSQRVLPDNAGLQGARAILMFSRSTCGACIAVKAAWNQAVRTHQRLPPFVFVDIDVTPPGVFRMDWDAHSNAPPMLRMGRPIQAPVPACTESTIVRDAQGGSVDSVLRPADDGWHQVTQGTRKDDPEFMVRVYQRDGCGMVTVHRSDRCISVSVLSWRNTDVVMRRYYTYNMEYTPAWAEVPAPKQSARVIDVDVGTEWKHVSRGKRKDKPEWTVDALQHNTQNVVMLVQRFNDRAVCSLMVPDTNVSVLMGRYYTYDTKWSPPLWRVGLA